MSISAHSLKWLRISMVGVLIQLRVAGKYIIVATMSILFQLRVDER